MLKKDKLGEDSFARSLWTILGIVFANLMIGATIILLIGSNPIEAYWALVVSAFGDLDAITNVLTRAAPLLLSGLAVAVAFTAGIYNLGGEGQIYLGALGAAATGYLITGFDKFIHLPLILVISVAAGMIGAWIPGWLRIRFKVDEVISTMLLNSVYILLTQYLANGPFRDPERWSGTTPQIESSARLPVIWSATGLNIGFLISIIVAVLIFYLMNYFDIGYRWKMIGRNPRFARYGGTKVGRDQMSAMLLSGALAGLAGGLLVAGSQFRFWAQIGAGIGWDGVLIALLANNNPLGVIVAGILFAAVKTGSLGMEIVSSVPSELTNVLLALMILFVTGRNFVTLLLRRNRSEPAKRQEANNVPADI